MSGYPSREAHPAGKGAASKDVYRCKLQTDVREIAP